MLPGTRSLRGCLWVVAISICSLGVSPRARAAEDPYPETLRLLRAAERASATRPATQPAVVLTFAETSDMRDLRRFLGIGPEDPFQTEDLLRLIADESKGATRREWAAGALARQPDRTMDMALGFLQSPDTTTRRCGVMILEGWGTDAVPALLHIMATDASWQVKEKCAYVVANIRGRRAVQANTVWEALALIGDADCVRALEIAVNSGTSAGQAATRAIAQVRNPAAVKELARIAQGENSLAGRAREALSEIHDDAAVDQLVAVLTPLLREPYRANDVIGDIAKTGRPKAYAYLMDLVLDPNLGGGYIADGSIPSEAARWIQRGDQTVVSDVIIDKWPAVVKRFSAPPELPAEAGRRGVGFGGVRLGSRLAFVCYAMTGSADPRLLPLWKDVLSWIPPQSRAFGRGGGHITPPADSGTCLAYLLAGLQKIGQPALPFLKEMRADPANQNLYPPIDRVLAAVEGTDPMEVEIDLALHGATAQLRIQGVERLEGYPGDKAIEVRLAAFKDPEAAMRQRAIERFSFYATPEVYGERNPPPTPTPEQVKRVADVAVGVLNDPDAKVREAAIRLLTGLRATWAADDVAELLGDPRPQVRAAAISMVSSTQDPKWIDALLASLGDADALVREAAVNVLGANPDQRAMEALIRMARQEVHPARAGSTVRTAAVKALGRRGDPEAVPVLIYVATHPAGGGADAQAEAIYGYQLRRDAIAALAKLGDRSAVPALLEMACQGQGETNAQMYWRKDAIGALGMLADPRALEPLIDLAQREPMLTASAYNALGAINDRKAMEVLLTALFDANTPTKDKDAAATGLGRMDKALVLPAICPKVIAAPEPPNRLAIGVVEKLSGQYLATPQRVAQWWQEHKAEYDK